MRLDYCESEWSSTVTAMAERKVQRRWRDYQTAAGGRPVKKFLMALSEEDRASVIAAMADVRNNGLSAAKHVQDDIYEVKADGDHATYRVLFAVEGERSQVLLSLEALSKKSLKLPKTVIDTARRRLSDWRRRSRDRPAARSKAAVGAGLRATTDGAARVALYQGRDILRAIGDREITMARTEAEPDFLDEMIEESTAANPAFPGMLAEAIARRETLRTLAEERKAADLTQTAAAAAMGTSQSAVGKLETSASDALISTVQRYAKALGMKVQLVFLDEDSKEPSVVVKRGQRARPKGSTRTTRSTRTGGRTLVAAKAKTTPKATRSTSKRTTAKTATAKSTRKSGAKPTSSKRSRTVA